jgi:carbon-monoxide dehydrogenase medium subunit
VLERNELITAVTVPPLEGREAAYVKVTARSADDWPALGIAISFALNDDTIRDPIVIVSAATEKVTRLTDAERVLHGGRLDDRLLRHAGDAAAKEAIILADAHGSAGYKRELLRVYLGRAVQQAIDRGAGLRQ